MKEKHQCQFEQRPIYPRCDLEATHFMITRTKGDRGTHKAYYCGRHLGFVMQQLKGTYVKIVSYGTIFEKEKA